MANKGRKFHEPLQRDLAALKLQTIAAHYREVLDEAAREGRSMPETPAHLAALEAPARAQPPLERPIKPPPLPSRQTFPPASTASFGPAARTRSPDFGHRGSPPGIGMARFGSASGS